MGARYKGKIVKPFSSSSPALQKLVANQVRLSALVTITLLLLTAWILGRLFWFPYQQPQLTKWQPTSSSTESSAQESLDLASLYNSHLFGQYQAVKKTTRQPKLEDAPKSRLNIIVVGVVTSTNPEKNLAVIAKNNQQATYGIDEVIEGTRVKLVQVQSDRIIIENAGRNETLMLEGLKYSSPVNNERSSASLSNQTKNKLAQIRAEIASNPQQIFQYVRMSQLKRNGEAMGYRLSAGKSRELFDAVGLKEGDVATHLNGQDLRNTAAMGEIFNSLVELTELNLTVERDGQPYDIYIEL